MIVLNRVFYIGLIAAVSACSHNAVKDEDSVFYAVPVG